MKKSISWRVGSLVAFVAAMTLSACDSTGAGETSTSTVPPTTQTTAAPTTTVSTTPPETTQPAEPLPTNPSDYATAAFEAWVAGDAAQLERLLTAEALEELEQVTVDPAADWEFTRCEGAAGSSYCEWLGPDGALTLRVGNEAASQGEEQAIAEVLVSGG